MTEKSRITASSILSALLLVLGWQLSQAQDRLDPIAMGKGRASVASARGLGALASNPGNLDLADADLGQPFTFSLYTFGLTIGTTYLNGEEYRQLFGSKPNGPSSADLKMIGEILGEEEKLFANGGINLFSVRYSTPESGTFGLAYGHRVYTRVALPSDLSYLISTLNIAGKDFLFTNRDGVGGDWITELGFSYAKTFRTGGARWFPEVGIGLTAKYLRGIVHFELDRNSILSVTQSSQGGGIAFAIKGGYRFRSAESESLDRESAVSQLMSALIPPAAGSGLGADIGIGGVLLSLPGRHVSENVKAIPVDAIRFGITAQNLGSITWTEGVYERTKENIDTTLTNSALSAEELRQYEGSLVQMSEMTTSTPAVLRAGLTANLRAFTDISTPLDIDVEGEFPLNDVPGNAHEARFGVGANWRASRSIALRGGVSIGGISQFGVGLGVGIYPNDWLAIDIGTSEINSIVTGERLDLAARLSVGLTP